ncbi:MAG: fumarate reductase subunit D [Gammaproteobacteria bacterium]|nr:fumarate reductase subunit D [Gammaproteobacteria bacterium]MDH4256303.1 fumarate reductase subunit D [Gammaproteobacteria bacterium]MDH5311617.1 fumarate reductase subunit D [Gammaproteobacteria bacterium]
MARSHKPIVWGLFAAGGTLSAFVLPVLILLTCFAVPLGLAPADLLAYERVLGLLGHPAAKLAVFGVLFLVIWHAAHRMRITAHDVGIRADTLVAALCYGIAAIATVAMLIVLPGL